MVVGGIGKLCGCTISNLEGDCVLRKIRRHHWPLAQSLLSKRYAVVTARATLATRQPFTIKKATMLQEMVDILTSNIERARVGLVRSIVKCVEDINVLSVLIGSG